MFILRTDLAKAIMYIILIFLCGVKFLFSLTNPLFNRYSIPCVHNLFGDVLITTNKNHNSVYEKLSKHLVNLISFYFVVIWKINFFYWNFVTLKSLIWTQLKKRCVCAEEVIEATIFSDLNKVSAMKSKVSIVTFIIGRI